VQVMQKMSDIYALPESEIERITNANATKIFQL